MLDLEGCDRDLTAVLEQVASHGFDCAGAAAPGEVTWRVEQVDRPGRPREPRLPDIGPTALSWGTPGFR
jgi:hypothetical protein